VSLGYCGLSKRQGDAPAYSDDRATYSRTWLFLLAVIRCYSAALHPKKRGFPQRTPTASLFFPAFQRKQDGAARR
jgi:hypothetical protein